MQYPEPMTRKKKGKKKSGGQSGGRRYSAGEIFVAVLGGAFLILVAGIVVTSLLGG